MDFENIIIIDYSWIDLYKFLWGNLQCHTSNAIGQLHFILSHQYGMIWVPIDLLTEMPNVCWDMWTLQYQTFL
jgi:hypothetical protein